MRLRSVFVVGFVGMGAVAAAACGSSGTGATCPPNSTLTYDNFGKAFFEANCNRCHAAATKGQTPLYDNVQGIRANKTQIDEQAASGPDSTNTDMPDDGDIATADRKKLGEWLACGAP